MMRSTIPILLLALGACSGSADEGADNAAAPVALVTLARAEQQPVSPDATLYGIAEGGPTGTVVLSAAAEATVSRIVTPVGTKVARGQVVALLAPTPNTRLDIAKASADARAADEAYARARRLRADGLVGDSEVETARAAAQSADATRSSLAGRAGALELRAPIDGFVQAVASNPGDVVQAGANVVTLARPGDLRARFGADPAVARAVRPGTPLRIAGTAGRPAITVPVQSVDPVVDPQTRLASVFARLPAGAGVAVGEALTGNVATASTQQALTIPYAALLDDGGQPYVFVVAGGIAHRRDVVTGPASGDRVAVVRGLGAGDRVVTGGGTAVEDGMKVRLR